jgi:putative ABC transport system permease protein
LPFVIEGRPALPAPATLGTPPGPQIQTANYFAVSRGYFGLMKIPIIKGRDFDVHDTPDSRQVAIINETMARQFFPDEDPIGKRIALDFVPEERPREIIAVVGDTVIGPLQRQQSAAVYVYHLQQASQWLAPMWALRAGMYFLLRTRGEPSGVVSAVKLAVAEVDRNTPAAEMATVEQILDKQIRNLRLYMLLLGIFAAVAAALAATGIYGVVAYSVAERTREIGIRMAMGGRARDIFLMVLRQTGWIIGVGLTLGLASAFAVTRVIQSALFGITATDTTTYITTSLMLLLIAVLACMIPARRAASVDPTVALKHE